MPFGFLGRVLQAAAIAAASALAVRLAHGLCNRVLNEERPGPAGRNGQRGFGGSFPSTAGSGRR